MKEVLKAYHNLKLKSKLMIAFTLVAFIPLIFVGIFLTTQMKSMALQQSVTDTETQLDRMVREIERVIEFNDTIHSSIIADSQLYHVIRKSYDSNLDIFLDYIDYTKMAEYEEIYREVDDIRLYIDNDTMLDNMDFMKLKAEEKETDWYREALELGGVSYVGYHYDRINKKSYMVMSRSIAKEGRDVIMSLIPLKPFNEMIALADGPYKILDQNGRVVASGVSSEIGQVQDVVYGMDVLGQGQFFSSQHEGKDYQFILRTIESSRLGGPLYVVANMPLEEILANANAASSLGFTIIILSLILATSFIFIFSGLLTRRLKVLEGNMNKVAKGEFESLEHLEGDDEIGQLSMNLDHMVSSLSLLMLENEAMHEKEKSLILAGEQTRFEMLANQINPHFMFNVLESIRMKAHLDGKDDLADIVALLGKLMRRGLEMTDEMISLEEELGFIGSYMEIQKFRFSDRFTFDVEVEEGLNEKRILPLLLQPIVENAVVHGMEGVSSHGYIHIKALSKGSSMILIVEDNGIGMCQEDLVQLQEDVETNHGTKKHIGLKNVNERIHIKYGMTYGLDIESECGNGTTVTIILPLETDDESI